MGRSEPVPVPSAAEIVDMAGRFRFPDGVAEAIAAAADACRTPGMTEHLVGAQRTLLEHEPGLALDLHRWPTPPVPLFYAVVLMSLVPQAELAPVMKPMVPARSIEVEGVEPHAELRQGESGGAGGNRASRREVGSRGKGGARTGGGPSKKTSRGDR